MESDLNPIIEMLGRRWRLAVIGGGPGSFIGETHRAAARIDDRYELLAVTLSSDPERSRLPLRQSLLGERACAQIRWQ
jgi:hypothetical protein